MRSCWHWRSANCRVASGGRGAGRDADRRIMGASIDGNGGTHRRLPGFDLHLPARRAAAGEGGYRSSSSSRLPSALRRGRRMPTTHSARRRCESPPCSTRAASAWPSSRGRAPMPPSPSRHGRPARPGCPPGPARRRWRRACGRPGFSARHAELGRAPVLPRAHACRDQEGNDLGVGRRLLGHRRGGDSSTPAAHSRTFLPRSMRSARSRRRRSRPGSPIGCVKCTCRSGCCSAVPGTVPDRPSEEVRSLVAGLTALTIDTVAGAGHRLAEERPDKVVEALTDAQAEHATARLH